MSAKLFQPMPRAWSRSISLLAAFMTWRSSLLALLPSSWKRETIVSSASSKPTAPRLFEQTDALDGDHAGAEDGQGGAGEGEFDDRRAGGKPEEDEIDALELRPQADGQEHRADQHAIHGQRVLVFEGAPHLVGVCEILELQADEQFPGQRHRHGAQKETQVIFGAQDVEGRNRQHGGEGHLVRGHEDVVDVGRVDDGEERKPAVGQIQPQPRRQPAEASRVGSPR